MNQNQSKSFIQTIAIPGTLAHLLDDKAQVEVKRFDFPTHTAMCVYLIPSTCTMDVKDSKVVSFHPLLAYPTADASAHVYEISM
jgi:hypothetical protein